MPTQISREIKRFGSVGFRSVCSDMAFLQFCTVYPSGS
jgi:hypothetical protein